MPPAARGKAHRAWRLAHSVNCIIRFAPCALRFANSPLQKLLIKAVMVCNLKESIQTMTAFGLFNVRRLTKYNE
jgi:hypothetical protein